MKSIFNLSGKTVLITGGAGLLGKKHAEAIIESGGRVIIGDVDITATNKVCDAFNKKHGKTVAHAEYLDVLNKDVVVEVAKKYKRIDVLINNAAKDTKVEKEGDLDLNARFETMSHDFWKKDMEVGLDGCFICSQVIANKMIEQGGGNIINIASDLSVIAPDQRIYKKEGISEDRQYVKPATYSVSKWAILGLTKYMSTYFASKNIRVNSLSPAGVYNNSLPEKFVSNLTSLIPMGRMADIDEYKGVITFLCSDASRYMTGQNLIIDGGRSVW